ncbi:hypothetical protein GEV49_03390 [Streptomyces sp. SYP-A7193]|nr:hypothetical protein GEV49_03390 [Streptomyces sp. SYP-A7193]
MGAPAFDREYFSKTFILAHFPHVFVALRPAPSTAPDRTSVTRTVRTGGPAEGRIVSVDASKRIQLPRVGG